MAVKKGKKQARRKDEPAIPGYVWLLVGLLVGGAVAVTAWVKLPRNVSDLLPHPNSTATPPSANASPAVPEGNPPEAASKKRKYDFYEVLPEREVVIPDQELSAQVKAEAAANLAAKQQAALASGAASTAASPGTAPVANAAANVASPSNGSTNTASVANPPASSHAAPTATAASIANATASTANAQTPPTPAVATEPRSGQYLLQAGAFKNNEQADDLKARIAMLGLVGHVETVQTPAGEMHRVRLGPYATASELEAAKQKLGAGGLPAIAVRVK